MAIMFKILSAGPRDASGIERVPRNALLSESQRPQWIRTCRKERMNCFADPSGDAVLDVPSLATAGCALSHRDPGSAGGSRFTVGSRNHGPVTVWRADSER
jgi:hypothetical protein